MHYSHSQIPTSMDKAGRISQAMPNTSLSYSLIYDLEDEYVFILAVMHSSRKPNYWVDRL